MGFEVLTVESYILRDTLPCSPVEAGQLFGEKYRFRVPNEEKAKQEISMEQVPHRALLASYHLPLTLQYPRK
jgi:hypothetical protein